MHSSASTPPTSRSAQSAASAPRPTPEPAPDPADAGAGSPATWSLPEPGSQAEPRAGATGTTSPSAPGDLPQDTVWSARTHVPAAAPEPAPGGLRTGTLVWGVLLVVLGGLLIATAMGTRLNLGVVSIAIVGTIGAFMVLLALIPFPRGPRH